MLMDEADADARAANWLTGRGQGATVDVDRRPSVGVVEARQDLDQRGFARAVLPKQAVHFAVANREI